jgi:hypothetical protein
MPSFMYSMFTFNHYYKLGKIYFIISHNNNLENNTISQLNIYCLNSATLITEILHAEHWLHMFFINNKSDMLDFKSKFQAPPVEHK